MNILRISPSLVVSILCKECFHGMFKKIHLVLKPRTAILLSQVTFGLNRGDWSCYLVADCRARQDPCFNLWSSVLFNNALWPPGFITGTLGNVTELWGPLQNKLPLTQLQTVIVEEAQTRSNHYQIMTLLLNNFKRHWKY